MEAEVKLLSASASGDVTLVDGLAAMVNEVYAVAEQGLWIDGVARTTSAKIADLMRAGELAVARRDGAIAGCVRVQQLDDYRGEFGMLAAHPAQRGTGAGRALLRFAEELSTARRLRIMQLELPTTRLSHLGPPTTPRHDPGVVNPISYGVTASWTRRPPPRPDLWEMAVPFR